MGVDDDDMLDEIAAAERSQSCLLGFAVDFLVDGNVAVEATGARHGKMHGFDRGHNPPNEIVQTPFFWNPAEHPGVPVASEDVLKDRVFPTRDRAYFDDVSESLRAVVTGEFAEGSFYLLYVGKHMPFDYHFGVSRNQEICSQSFRWSES